MAAPQQTRRLTARLSDALLEAQRQRWRPPRAVRRAARSVLGRHVAGDAAVEPWDRPLVGDGPLAPAPVQLASDQPRRGSPRASRHVPDPSLTCLVVTGVLDVGGSDEVVAFLARRLPEHGIETAVVHTGTHVVAAQEAGGRLARYLRRDGIRVVEATETTASALIDELQPDVISAHGAPAWWLDLATLAGIPYVETLHGMHSLFGADWTREASRSSRITHLIAVSELVRQQYLTGNATFDPTRITTVPNSVDGARMPSVSRDAARTWLNVGDDFVFLSLARHSLQKNTYALIRAFADLAARHPDARLVVAGRPDDPLYAHQLRRLRDSLPVRDRIHLRDHAPWPAALLAAADAFVLDSFFEGWSLASMEALYAGVPVVLSDVGGAREQVGDQGQRGILVGNPIRDAMRVNWDSIRAYLYASQPNHEELVAAMCRMVEERGQWAAGRRTLQEQSAQRFHPDRALSGHAAALRGAAQQSPA